MLSSSFMLIPVLLPIIAGFLWFPMGLRLHDNTRAREAALMAITVVTSLAAWAVILFGSAEPLELFHFTDSLPFVLRIDGLGKLFTGLVATLWPITMLYAFEYMRYEHRQRTFFAFFLMAYGVTLGIAMAGNLVTMYCWYEMLTLSTVYLVLHPMTKQAVRAARAYLIYSIGGAAFGFIGMIFLIMQNAGGLFTLGGQLTEYAGNINILCAVFAMGFLGFSVKAAVFPFHGWLVKAAVAPTPVTALLHAVAVVKAGAFACLRFTYYCFSPDLMRGTWGQWVVQALVIFTIVFGSAMSLKETHLKRRLAYSTVSNLSYVLFGVTLMTRFGMMAAMLHILFHAVVKILGFFNAGAILHETGLQYLPDLNGMARKMPVTYATFTISALGLSGIPLFNGFISKWSLLLAAGETHSTLGYIGAAALLISALLTAVYMFSVVIRGYFPRRDADLAKLEGFHEANAYMLVPFVILAAFIIITGVYCVPLETLTQNIANGLF